jgi:formylglycine-generating enzyme required for sulfatase activity
LPTEAEWEYAARAGTTGPRYGDLDGVAWYSGNAGGTTHPVRQKRANAWGLYDMLGNVWEWCHDWYGDYPGGAARDPAGPGAGSCRVLRGGSWGLDAWLVRAANRDRDTPGYRYENLGFRTVRSSP